MTRRKSKSTEEVAAPVAEEKPKYAAKMRRKPKRHEKFLRGAI